MKNILAFLIQPYNLTTIIAGIILTIVLMIISSKNHTKSYQLRAYIPTIWTSLGIFFTFFAIWKGLPAIKNVEENKILETLIDKVIPAFSTSIIGIAGAVITSLINKIILAVNEKDGNVKFDKRNPYKDKGIDANSPELLLFEMISAVNQKGDSIENILKSNKTSKEGNLYGALDKLLQQLNGITKSSIDTQTAEIQTGFEIVNEQIESTNSSLNSALKTQKNDFLGVIKEMQGTFDTAMKNHNTTLSAKMDEQRRMLQEEIGNMKNDNNVLITSFVNSVKSDFVTVVKENIVKESIDRTEKLQTFITNEDGKIKEFVNEQKSMYQEIKKGLDDTVSDIRELFEEDVKQTIEQFAEKQHEISATTIELCNTKLVEDSNEYLKNHTGMMSIYLDKLERQTNYTCDTFLGSVDTLLKTIKTELDELHNKDSELIGTTIKENEDNVNRLLGENKSAIEAIANGIKEDYEKIKTELQASQDRWKEQAKMIEQDNLDKIKAINADAEGKVQAINEAITTLGDGLQAAFNGIKAKIEASIKENTTNLNGLLEANKGSIQKVSQEIKSDNESIKAHLTKTNQNWKAEVAKINQDAANEILEIQTKVTSIESTLQSSLNGIKEKITESISGFENQQEKIRSFILENNKGLQTDLTNQIRAASQINELSIACGTLTNRIDATISSLNKQTSGIMDNLSIINDSLKKSSEKYNSTIVNSDDLITDINGTLHLFKSYITTMNAFHTEMNALHSEMEVFQKTIKELEKSIKLVQETNKQVNVKTKQGNKKQ